MKKIGYLLILLIGCNAFAQQKFEREYRVNKNKVPKKSVDFVHQCNFKKKVKWYVEESQDGTTFEAKVYKKKHLYSIEFLENGTLLDVEKRVKFSKLPKDIKKRIRKTLAITFKKYHIKKTQKQWKGNSEKLMQFITKKQKVTKEETAFEIVVKGRRNKEYHLFEILFNHKGKILKKLQFAPINSDNLEF